MTGITLVCTGRRSHEPQTVIRYEDGRWSPQPRNGNHLDGHELRCPDPRCGRNWRFGVRRARALVDAAEMPGVSGTEIDLSYD